MGTKRGAMAGGKQVHCVIWADGAGDDGESPDSRRKTSGKQVGVSDLRQSRRLEKGGTAQSGLTL
jgi:hypothetical protein